MQARVTQPGRTAGQSIGVRLSMVAGLSVIAAACFFAPLSASAQEQSRDSSQENASPSIDLPLIGEIDLPSWLSFLATSEGEGEKAQGGDGQGANAQGGNAGSGQGGSDRPPAVVVTAAELQSVGEEFTFIGRIQAIEEVTLQPRVNGFIEQVFFQGGEQVSVGEQLFKIEDDQYQASLQSAQAQLAGAQAQRAEAERSLKRAQELIDSGTIPQAQLDQAQASFESARASELQAEASVRQAQLNLDYTSIEAPIDGVISEAMITKGNFVSAASGTLAEIVQLDPIWGSFPIGENRLATWRRVRPDEATPEGETTAVGAQDGSADPNPQAVVDNYRLSLRLPNSEEYQPEGAFAFVGNTVDPTTGTIEVRIRFPNPDGILLPNENVTLVAEERDPPRLPVIPQAAVQLNRDGRSVFLLDQSNNTVRRQPIETGKTLRGNVAVVSGLQDGDLVVVQGVQNIQDGAKVTPSFQNSSQTSQGPSATNGAAADAEGSSQSQGNSGPASGGDAGSGAGDGSGSESQSSGAESGQ
ncbi:efflux RND transporter periplasmic adaptor subunit [Fulvimarina manganoxydans]|uniref:efflux RND transporter periplasmic adaptor subunit n=1 Tax=Fulvimarina manganoxydans TaxID=937218 RepID=UPI002354EA20|nr:efflux RND transporter periplasmic adaptor subunit [Fulvimarina manganoxydans]